LWREYFFSGGVIDKDNKNPRTDFKRIKDQLVTKGAIGELNGLVWSVKDDNPN